MFCTSRRLKQAAAPRPPTSPILSSSSWRLAESIPSLLPRSSISQVDWNAAGWPQQQQQQQPLHYPTHSSSYDFSSAAPRPPVRPPSPLVYQQFQRPSVQELTPAVNQTAIERRLAFELNNTPHSTEALLSYLQHRAGHEPYMTQSQVKADVMCCKACAGELLTVDLQRPSYLKPSPMLASCFRRRRCSSLRQDSRQTATVAFGRKKWLKWYRDLVKDWPRSARPKLIHAHCPGARLVDGAVHAHTAIDRSGSGWRLRVSLPLSK